MQYKTRHNWFGTTGICLSFIIWKMNVMGQSKEMKECWDTCIVPRLFASLFLIQLYLSSTTRFRLIKCSWSAAVTRLLAAVCVHPILQLSAFLSTLSTYLFVYFLIYCMHTLTPTLGMFIDSNEPLYHYYISFIFVCFKFNSILMIILWTIALYA